MQFCTDEFWHEAYFLRNCYVTKYSNINLPRDMDDYPFYMHEDLCIPVEIEQFYDKLENPAGSSNLLLYYIMHNKTLYDFDNEGFSLPFVRVCDDGFLFKVSLGHNIFKNEKSLEAYVKIFKMILKNISENSQIERIEDCDSRVMRAQADFYREAYDRDSFFCIDSGTKDILNLRYKHSGDISYKQRAVGLWLWDQIHLWKKTKKLSRAVELLYDTIIDGKVVMDEISLPGTSHRAFQDCYNQTAKSIAQIKILPMKYKKK